MILLVAGVALWWLAHLFKRLAPGLRAGLGEGPGKGAVALALIASLVLMVIGYRQAEFVEVYVPPAWGWHVNNLLMFLAVALYAMRGSRGTSRAWLRHPMLTGTVLWGVAHLLANGDLASLILFGGLALWALVEIPVINAAEGPWQRPAPGTLRGDILLLVMAAVGYAAIILIHWQLLGVRPFPG
jgi:uncharacterized membrane protein